MDKIKEIKEHVGSLIKERGLSYNSLSLKYGKSGTYLHKFVTAEAPKRLDEAFRKALAKELGVPEQELTDIDLSPPSFEPPFITAAGALYDKTVGAVKKAFKADAVNIDIIDVTACCGGGIENFSENRIGSLNIPLQEFKEITNISPANVKLIRATGDSMEPTINDGDRVWVDTSNNYFTSDGIYLIRIASSIVIKRIQIGPTGITVKSDNARYGDFPLQDGCQIVGKVIYIWNGRRV